MSNKAKLKEAEGRKVTLGPEQLAKALYIHRGICNVLSLNKDPRYFATSWDALTLDVKQRYTDEAEYFIGLCDSVMAGAF